MIIKDKNIYVDISQAICFSLVKEQRNNFLFIYFNGMSVPLYDEKLVPDIKRSEKLFQKICECKNELGILDIELARNVLMEKDLPIDSFITISPQ